MQRIAARTWRSLVCRMVCFLWLGWATRYGAIFPFRFHYVPGNILVAEKVIIVLVVVAHTGRTEPTADGPPSDGKQDAHQKHWQPPAVARVQPGGQPVAPLRPFVRTLPVYRRHPWLSYHVCPEKHVVIEEPFSLQDQFSDWNRPKAVFSESAGGAPTASIRSAVKRRKNVSEDHKPWPPRPFAHSKPAKRGEKGAVSFNASGWDSGRPTCGRGSNCTRRNERSPAGIAAVSP